MNDFEIAIGVITVTLMLIGVVLKIVELGRGRR